MKIILCAISTFIIIITSNTIFSQNENIRDSVRVMGLQNDQSDFNRLHYLRDNYEDAIKYLVEELHTIKNVTRIPPEQYLTYKDAGHVVWCLRALRYLTDIDFLATSKYKFKKNEPIRKSLLTNEGTSKDMPFFVVRMARDVIYLAPTDTQIEIIRKWHNWYKENKGRIELKTNEDFNEWYF